MATQSSTLAVGAMAPDFTLPSTTGESVSLADFAGRPALLVVFICNHCPYVRHVESELARIAADYEGQGLGAVGISANDVIEYPDDDLAHMSEQARRAGFAFPYLYDESQAVARSYGAVCTPDPFLFDAERRLVYRGEIDGSRPNSGVPVSGASLRTAIEHVLAGEAVPQPHRPSVGCSIKWRSTA